MDRVNIAVVGYGMGRHHCGLIEKTQGLHLLGVSDLDEKKREQAKAEHPGIKTYKDLDEALGDPAVDLVSLCLPHHIHEAACVQAAKAKKHIVNEKPLAMTAEECDRMIQAAKENGVLLTVFQNRRWDVDYLTVKHVIEKGLLGEVFLMESRVGGWNPPGGWRAEKRFGGSILHDWGAHLIDQILQIKKGAAVASVYGQTQVRVWDTDTETHAKSIIQFKDGTQAQVEITRVAQIQLPRWFVLGTQGTLWKETLSGPGTRVKTQLHGLAAEMTIEPQTGDWADFYKNVYEAVALGKELLVKPEESREAIRVIAATRKSADTNELIKF